MNSINKKSKDAKKLVFGNRNYILMIIGVFFIVAGFVAMIFDKTMYGFGAEGEMGIVGFSLTLTIAPILIVIGLIIEFFAIFLKDNEHH